MATELYRYAIYDLEKVTPTPRDEAIYRTLFSPQGTRVDPSNPRVTEALEWPFIVGYRTEG